MKNFLFTRRSLGVGGFLVALLLLGLLPETLLAQKLNVWKGGQAGQPREWNCPRNWSLGIVPDWTCVAVIEQNFQNGTQYPIVKKAMPSVQYLMVFAGAGLEIGPQGYLEVDSWDACLFEGTFINKGHFQLDGKLVASQD